MCPMVHEDWLERISAYVDGECAADEARAVEGHLAVCEPCRDHHEAMEHLHRRVRLVPADAHVVPTEALIARLAVAPRRRTDGAAVRVLAAAAVVAVVVGVIVASFSGGGAPANDVASGATSVPGVGAVVRATDRAFASPEVQVASGQSVEWANEQKVAHEIVVRLPGGAVSERLDDGERVTVTFDDPGRYHYYCMIHSGMQGEVVVTQ